MKASVKCSNCGAEISNLNFSWGKKQWLWIVPILLISFFPMWNLYKPKGNYRTDLRITVLEKRVVDKNLEILGIVENVGKTTWKNIELDAEFYNADNKFIDEADGRVSSSVDPGKKEHFKIDIQKPSQQITADNIRLELKVADAYSNMF